MARLAATGHTELGFDSIMPVFSIIQESSAHRLQDPVGAEGQLADGEDDASRSTRRPDDIRIPDDWLEHPDTQCVLEAIKHPAQAIRRRGRDHRQDHGPVVARLPHVRRRAVPAHVARRPGARRSTCWTRSRRSTIEFGMAQIEAGADALTLPDHATGDLVSRRVLPPLPARHAHRVRRGAADARSSCTSAGARWTAWATSPRPGMAAFHYDSKNEPAESMAAVDGRDQPRRQHQQPRDAVLEGPGRGAATRCRKNLEAGVQMVGPECAIPLQTPIENLHAIREAVRDWHERARRQPRKVATWRNSATSANEFIRAEIEEFIERPGRARAHDQPVRAAASPTLQEIAAALIDGDDDTGRRAHAAARSTRARRRSR